MSAPTSTTSHTTAYQRLMHDLLERAATRIARQHEAAGTQPAAVAEEVRDDAAQPPSRRS